MTGGLRLSARLRSFGLGLSFVAGMMGMAPAATACTQATGRQQIFFLKRPTNIPAGLVIVRVRVPAKVEEGREIPAEILDAVDSNRVIDRIGIRVSDVDYSACTITNLGPTGEPVYAVGVYERSGDGPTYFRAIWLNAVPPADLRGRVPADNYIVDPKVRAKADALKP